jgi:hypothetical protein
MTARIRLGRTSRFVLTLAFTAAGLAAAAGDARANCFTTPPKSLIVQPRLQAQRSPAAQLSAAAQASDKSASGHQIVGMWATIFFADTPMGPALWDQGFELFHEDGTELAIDNAVPPSLGNVCIGVWKSLGPKTIKLRHMTFNWNADGTPAGTFLLLLTATVSQDGKGYAGTFVSDSFDLNGDPIAAYHAEGTVRGTRITVD